MKSLILVALIAMIFSLHAQDHQPELIKPIPIDHQTNNPNQNIQTNPEQTQQYRNPHQPRVDIHAHQGQQPASIEGFDWQNLTQDQKKLLLQEEAKLAELHKNPQKDLSEVANMTLDEKQQYHRKMEERAKLAYEQAMKEMEERERKYVEDYNRMMEEQKLTMTQEINHKEQTEFRERQNQFNPRQFENSKGSFYRHQFNQYMFQLQEGQSNDFTFSLPVAQDIAFFLYTYSNKDGVYSMTTDITHDKHPPYVSVVQNNYQIIKNQSFYFRKYVIFQGKQHYTYTIKVTNPGQSRLFALSVVHLLQHAHISSAMATEQIATHATRAEALYRALQNQIGQNQNKRMMQISNHNNLNKGIQAYYSYIILEMLLVIGGCFIQLQMIKKLLSGSSVV